MMATSSNQRDIIPTSPSDEKIILTLEGYKKLFEKCEDTSDGFSCYAKLFDIYDPTNWRNKLGSWKLMGPVNCLFNLRTILFKEEKLMQHNDYVTLIQYFSLLENVFRNVLLRPYIPAYRTINKDCGRYHSFIQPYENVMPLAELQFESNGSNLLTYVGTNQTETILYALTCSILCHYFIIRLETFDRDPYRQQRP